MFYSCQFNYSLDDKYFSDEKIFFYEKLHMVLDLFHFNNPTLLGGNQTVIDAAPTNVLYIIENYKATLIIFFPILFALAYIFDNILIWIKKRFIKK